MGPVRPLLLINGPMRSLCYIRPRIGRVIVYHTDCILSRVSFDLLLQRRLYPIFVKLWVSVKRTQ